MLIPHWPCHVILKWVLDNYVARYVPLTHTRISLNLLDLWCSTVNLGKSFKFSRNHSSDKEQRQLRMRMNKLHEKPLTIACFIMKYRRIF
jgi:hypothetical protein